MYLIYPGCVSTCFVCYISITFVTIANFPEYLKLKSDWESFGLKSCMHGCFLWILVLLVILIMLVVYYRPMYSIPKCSYLSGSGTVKLEQSQRSLPSSYLLSATYRILTLVFRFKCRISNNFPQLIFWINTFSDDCYWLWFDIFKKYIDILKKLS